MFHALLFFEGTSKGLNERGHVTKAVPNPVITNNGKRKKAGKSYVEQAITLSLECSTVMVQMKRQSGVGPLPIKCYTQANKTHNGF